MKRHSQAETRELLYRHREGCLCGLAREFWNDSAESYADRHLEKLEVREDGWEVQYGCPMTDEIWVEDYPLGAEHGGGPTRLRRVSAD